jgi:hypothetical protein
MESDKITICNEEGHDYVYSPSEHRHYCKNCEQEPPPEWYDIFAD